MEKQKIAQSVESFFNKVFPDVIASPVLKSYPHLYPNLNIEKQGTQFAKLAKNGKPSSRFLFWLESKLVPQAAHLDNDSSTKVIFVTLFFSILMVVGVPFILWCLVDWIFFCNSDHVSIKDKFQVLFYAFAATIALYWNLRAGYTGKWNYCATIFNKLALDELPKLLEEKPRSSPIRIMFISTLLAVDLVDLRFWSHKSFRGTFKEALEVAIFYKYAEDGGFEYQKIKSMVEDFLNKKTIDGIVLLDKEEARTLLANFQEVLSNYLILSGYQKLNGDGLSTS